MLVLVLVLVSVLVLVLVSVLVVVVVVLLLLLLLFFFFFFFVVAVVLSSLLLLSLVGVVVVLFCRAFVLVEDRATMILLSSLGGDANLHTLFGACSVDSGNDRGSIPPSTLPLMKGTIPAAADQRRTIE